jgi:hypothetical protein
MPDNPIQFYEQFGKDINELVKSKNYEVAPLKPKGQPGKNVKSVREYRLQLINKSRDTSKDLITFLQRQLRFTSGVKNVSYNEISPNSSKFPSFGFTVDGYDIDLIIARGANRGENFETRTVNDLKSYFNTSQDRQFAQLITQMNEAFPPFADVEIVDVKQRRGATKKEGVPIERLGAIIGDIILTDATGKDWFVSLKDINGLTFSSYSGAASLFNAQGDLQPDSAGAKFLEAFGVDLNLVQEGFDERQGFDEDRDPIPVKRFNNQNLIPIFERAWGMNYFYVKKERMGWQVFWIDYLKLKQLTHGLQVTEIRYPGLRSKQISILLENKYKKYIVEVRNSKAGEYPNDTKFRIRPG